MHEAKIDEAKIFKGQPRRFALWELAPNWYKTIPPDHIDQVQINDSPRLRNTKGTVL